MLGEVSDNRVMPEFEAAGVAEGYRDRWLELLRERGYATLADRYLAGLVMSSPSGGLNGFVQVESDEPVGSERLISRERTPEEAAKWREANGKDKSVVVPPVVLAEVKGDRGYAVVWPSHGPVHDAGRPYRLVVGFPETCPVYTEDEFRILCQTARELSPVKEKPRRTRWRCGKAGR
jgi:putative DNA primase/helicase